MKSAFPARFAGTCSSCNEHINIGDLIRWSRKERGKVWHDQCPSGAGHEERRSDEPNENRRATNATNNKIAERLEHCAICKKAILPGDAYIQKDRIFCTECNKSEPNDNSKLEPEPKPEGLLNLLAESIAPYLEQRISGLVDEAKVEAIINRLFDGMVFRQVNEIVIHDETKQESRDMGIQHRQFKTLLQACNARTADGFRLNVWLTGPAGSGKTVAAKNCAEALGLKFFFTGSIDTEYKLLGFVDAQGRIVNTQFRQAYQEGGVFLFDEVDSSLPAALLAFNAALANGECAFPDGIIQRHADFVCIAAANTWGLGATHDYVGRLKLDASFLDRFPAKIAWEYDSSLELATVGNNAWVARVQALREKARQKGLKVIISPRASYGGAALLATGMDQDMVEQLTIRQAMSEEQWSMIQ